MKKDIKKIFFFKNSRIGKNNKIILNNLNNFGFSIKDTFHFDENKLSEITDYFYKNFEAESKKNVKSPMIYSSLSKKNIDYVVNHLNQNYYSLISKYLFNFPYLKTICYMYSKNSQDLSGSSQYWHLDKQGPRTLKIFIALHDMDYSNGPLTFLDASKTKYITNLLNYNKTTDFKRISDSCIEEELCSIDIISNKFTGKRGSVAFLDTDRCLHFGSRKSEHSRLFLYIEYGSIFDYTIPSLIYVN
tara:strand:- start:2607 stop:3341 length:735 start_codon:yes stop_codon:yes gene_type:complete